MTVRQSARLSARPSASPRLGGPGPAKWQQQQQQQQPGRVETIIAHLTSDCQVQRQRGCQANIQPVIWRSQGRAHARVSKENKKSCRDALEGSCQYKGSTYREEKESRGP